METGDRSARRHDGLTRLAVFLAIACVAGGAVAAVWAYRAQRDILLDQIAGSHLDEARALASFAARHAVPGDEASMVAAVRTAWAQSNHREAHAAVCLIGKDGRLLYHSRRKDVVGEDVRGEIIRHSDPAIHTYGDLLARRMDYAGIHVTAGPPEMVAFAFEPRLEALIGVHVPISTIEHHFWHASRPWIGALCVVLGVLFPLSLFLLHRAYLGAQQETETLRETERAMQKRLLQSERMAAVGTLAAGVAHEINNPLAYVMGNLELLERLFKKNDPGGTDPPDERVEAALADATEGAERVRRIVRDLGAFARPEEENDMVPVDVHEVLERAIAVAANELRHRAQLERRFGDVGKVEANAGRLEQVFLNLLMNAAQAIPVGHAEEHRITVDTTRGEDDEVIVRVSDTGTGISKETIERVFEPFFTTKAVGEGSGLGLYVCRSLVAAMGGRLDLESRPGEGTIATVTLRAAQDEPPTEADGQPSSEPSPAPARILVIDDEESLGVSLKRALMGIHDVDVETSGEAALARLENDQGYDLVLCDLMMPDVTGMDVYARLRKTDPELADRLVFTTGGAFTEEARRFLESVDNQRLDKPFRLAEIDALLARHRGHEG